VNVRDTFIVFTSNVFALLGMRALYFLLAGTAGLSWRATRGSTGTRGRAVTRTGAGRSGYGS